MQMVKYCKLTFLQAVFNYDLQLKTGTNGQWESVASDFERGLGMFGSDRYKSRINACLVNLFVLVVLVL